MRDLVVMQPNMLSCLQGDRLYPSDPDHAAAMPLEDPFSVSITLGRPVLEHRVASPVIIPSSVSYEISSDNAGLNPKNPTTRWMVDL